ncbi:hypothetical protein H6G00_01425 [Leptolyngbya sp. FACHB-541]|uniref:hypothetical protein n=1 Tax=Leptolyngbya sp. FACHB-541 TaxID=2692810 RepID=UPI0016831F4F|nr:hypothetical protein [Leptolyngbya sp. FACHB-541]MBD1995290.1 hypothetical protein [Leptolyngbya sp. FACHB-541]
MIAFGQAVTASLAYQDWKYRNQKELTKQINLKFGSPGERVISEQTVSRWVNAELRDEWLEIKQDTLKLFAPFVFRVLKIVPVSANPQEGDRVILDLSQTYEDCPEQLLEIYKLREVVTSRTYQHPKAGKIIRENDREPAMTETGWKYVAAVMKTARLALDPPHGMPIYRLIDVLASSSAVVVSPEELIRFELGNHSLQDPPRPRLIMGLVSLEHAINPATGKPYTSEEVAEIALGEVIPINPETGKPFSKEELRALGIAINGECLSHN